MTASENPFWLGAFQEHGSSLLAFLRSRLGRRDLAEDLLQETFVRAMRRGPDVADPSRIRAYLFTTAHHLVIDQARRKRFPLLSEIGEPGAWDADRVADEGEPSAELFADLGRLEERLGAILARLPEAQRIAFEAAVLGQEAYAEIASRQGWTVEKVKISVFRARKRVIAELGEQMRPNAEMPS